MKYWSESTFSGRPFHVYLSPSLASYDSPFSGRAISTARCFRLLLHSQSFVQLLALGSGKEILDTSKALRARSSSGFQTALVPFCPMILVSSSQSKIRAVLTE
jgi:hypothetical protein